MADVTPLHKKGKTDLQENYRTVSILPIFLKVLKEACLQKCLFFGCFFFFFSKQQCGFLKGYSIQRLLALLKMEMSR